MQDDWRRLGLGFLGLGMWPDKTRADLPVMPKGRYKIMLNYMPKVGSLGLDMMLRTCTIQVNFDYSSEADMVKKFRVGLALQPVATALFANSPFTEGKPNGFKSFRSHIWEDTDPDRTGMLPFVFNDGFGYERYLRLCARRADVFRLPRRKVHRRRGRELSRLHGRQIAAIARRKAAPSRTWSTICRPSSPRCASRASSRCAAPTVVDGAVSARCRRFGSACSMTTALDAAWDLVKNWSIEERENLRHAVPRLALEAPVPGGGTVRELAREVVEIAADGLSRRARLNSPATMKAASSIRSAKSSRLA